MVDADPKQPKNVEFMENFGSLDAKVVAAAAKVASENSKDGLTALTTELQAMAQTQARMISELPSILLSLRDTNEVLELLQVGRSVEDIKTEIDNLQQRVAEKLVLLEGITSPEKAAQVAEVMKHLTEQIAAEVAKDISDQDRALIDSLQSKRNQMQDMFNAYLLQNGTGAARVVAPVVAGSENKAVDKDTVQHAREVLGDSRFRDLRWHFAQLGSRVPLPKIQEWAVGEAKRKIKADSRQEVAWQDKIANDKLNEKAILGFKLEELLAKDKAALTPEEKNNLRGIVLFLDKINVPSFAFIKPYADKIRAAAGSTEAQQVSDKIQTQVLVSENVVTVALKRRINQILNKLDLSETPAVVVPPPADGVPPVIPGTPETGKPPATKAPETDADKAKLAEAQRKAKARLKELYGKAKDATPDKDKAPAHKTFLIGAKAAFAELLSSTDVNKLDTVFAQVAGATGDMRMKALVIASKEGDPDATKLIEAIQKIK